MMNLIKNWKLKLKYGKLKTEFRHYTVLADGLVGELSEGFQCRSGRAFMGMKIWATDTAESADMIKVIGAQIGFTVDGDVQIFETDPIETPGEKPSGYDIQFTPYEK